MTTASPDRVGPRVTESPRTKPDSATQANTTPPRRHPRLDEPWVKYIFLTPAALFIALFFIYPVIKNVVMSFQQYSFTTFFNGKAPFAGFDNYTATVANPIFGDAVLNTFLFTIGSIVGQLVIGMLLALFFRKRFPGASVLRSLLLFPWLLPMIAAAAVWKWILEQDNGVLNTFLESIGVISSPIPWLTSSTTALISIIIVNIWLGIPFNVVLIHSGLQAIDEDVYEAGELDGATGFKAFRHLTLPLLRPVLSVVILLGVIYTIKVLDLILGLTGGGPANATETLATRSYELSFVEFDFGRGAALSNILIVIAVAFSLVYLWANSRASKEA